MLLQSTGFVQEVFTVTTKNSRVCAISDLVKDQSVGYYGVVHVENLAKPMDEAIVEARQMVSVRA